MSVGQFFLGEPGSGQLFEGRRSTLFERWHATVVPYRCVLRQRGILDSGWPYGNIEDDESYPTITDSDSNSMTEWVGSIAFGESYNPKHQYDSRVGGGEIWQQKHDPAPTDTNYVREEPRLFTGISSGTNIVGTHNGFSDFMIEFTGPLWGTIMVWQDDYTISPTVPAPTNLSSTPTLVEGIHLYTANDTHEVILNKPTVPTGNNESTYSWFLFYPKQRAADLPSPMPVPTAPIQFIGR